MAEHRWNLWTSPNHFHHWLFPELEHFGGDAGKALQHARYRYRHVPLLSIIPLIVLMRITGAERHVIAVMHSLVGWSPPDFLAKLLVTMVFMIGIVLLYDYAIRRPTQVNLRRQLCDRDVLVCLECGYDLRGQIELLCPECGKRFDQESIQAREIARDRERARRWWSKRRWFPELAYFSEDADEVFHKAAATWRHLGLGLFIVPFAFIGIVVGFVVLAALFESLRGVVQSIGPPVALAGSVFALLWLLRNPVRRNLRRELQRRGVPICIECGHDLPGQTEPTCPVCGVKFDGTLLETAKAGRGS